MCILRSTPQYLVFPPSTTTMHPTARLIHLLKVYFTLPTTTILVPKRCIPHIHHVVLQEEPIVACAPDTLVANANAQLEVLPVFEA